MVQLAKDIDATSKIRCGLKATTRDQGAGMKIKTKIRGGSKTQGDFN